MAGMSRQARRAFDSSGQRSIDVYAADLSRGWRVVRQVSTLYAYDQVASGKWQELFDDFGNFYGVQIVAAVKTDQELPSGASATTITARDCMLYAGLNGPSRTMGMNEDRRISRFSSITCKALPPEDRIERVVAKVDQWPSPASRIDSGRGPAVYGDRAPRVYPRMK